MFYISYKTDYLIFIKKKENRFRRTIHQYVLLKLCKRSAPSLSCLKLSKREIDKQAPSLQSRRSPGWAESENSQL